MSNINTFFKPFQEDDITTTRTHLHEHIPITGSILSGTYAVASSGRERNIKTHSHGMFQSVYDYPYVSSSANHIFDIAWGVSTSATSYSSSVETQVEKKVNIYNQMAQVLSGFDSKGKIMRFDADGDLIATGTKHDNVVFLNFSRLLVKDEIKKGSFNIKLGTNSSYANPFGSTVTVTDSHQNGRHKINSPKGDYGILSDGATNLGLIYYQAGIAVLTSSVFNPTVQMNSSGESIESVLTGSSIDQAADALRHRILNISFNNTTELNSTVYFCTANHSEFNYSSNPTYLSGSKIRVMDVRGESFGNMPVSYVTTVGLYSADNELLAVGKLSEPLRKDPANQLMLRVRLDF